jgi:Family of unknown function (DUF5715)
MHRTARAAVLTALLVAPAGTAYADGLAGSPSSMAHQHQIAVEEDYSFLRSPTDVKKLASAGALVPIVEGENLALSKVSFPFARPEVRSFVEYFAARYRDSTGARLVVTSLTRPSNAQPSNAHKLSVHPAGMAVDLRVPSDSADRRFLERSLLEMEEAGVLDVTRERSPAHYHIAVFAEKWAPYAARQDSLQAVADARRAKEEAAAKASRSAAASAREVPAGEGSRAGFLLGLLAAVGFTAPVLYRGSRNRLRQRASVWMNG